MTQVQATFWGAAFGASLGLFAILGGAMLNAHLNRKRDELQKLQESVALSTLVLAELTQLKLRLESRRDSYEHFDSEGLSEMPIVLFRSYKVPRPALLTAASDRLDLLPTESQWHVAAVIARIDTINTGIETFAVYLEGKFSRGDPPPESIGSVRTEAVERLCFSDKKLHDSITSATETLESFVKPHVGMSEAMAAKSSV